MQIANALLNLGGDPGNQVPKYGITVPEIVLLRHIHGGESVNEIEPTGDIDRSDNDERDRLLEVFARPVGVKSPVGEVYPGAVARLHRSFDELSIPDAHFKAVTRVSRASPVAVEVSVPQVLAKPVKKPTKAQQAAEAKALAEAAAAAELNAILENQDEAQDILS